MYYVSTPQTSVSHLGIKKALKKAKEAVHLHTTHHAHEQPTAETSSAKSGAHSH